jgi:hypothetical protein
MSLDVLDVDARRPLELRNRLLVDVQRPVRDREIATGLAAPLPSGGPAPPSIPRCRRCFAAGGSAVWHGRRARPPGGARSPGSGRGQTRREGRGGLRSLPDPRQALPAAQAPSSIARNMRASGWVRSSSDEGLLRASFRAAVHSRRSARAPAGGPPPAGARTARSSSSAPRPAVTRISELVDEPLAGRRQPGTTPRRARRLDLIRAKYRAPGSMSWPGEPVESSSPAERPRPPPPTVRDRVDALVAISRRVVWRRSTRQRCRAAARHAGGWGGSSARGAVRASASSRVGHLCCTIGHRFLVGRDRTGGESTSSSSGADRRAAAALGRDEGAGGAAGAGFAQGPRAGAREAQGLRTGGVPRQTYLEMAFAPESWRELEAGSASAFSSRRAS